MNIQKRRSEYLRHFRSTTASEATILTLSRIARTSRLRPCLNCRSTCQLTHIGVDTDENCPANVWGSKTFDFDSCESTYWRPQPSQESDRTTTRRHQAEGVSGGVPPVPFATRAGPGGGIGIAAPPGLGRGLPGGGGGVARGAGGGAGPGNPPGWPGCGSPAPAGWLMGAAGGGKPGGGSPDRGLGGGMNPMGAAAGGGAARAASKSGDHLPARYKLSEVPGGYPL